MVVFGGGHIFHSANSSNWKTAFLQALQRNQGEIFAAAVGVSFGPFRDNNDRDAASSLASSLDFVIVRDAESFSFAKSHVKPGTPVVLAPDISLATLSLKPEVAAPLTRAEPHELAIGSLLVAPNGGVVQKLPLRDRWKFRRQLVDFCIRRCSQIDLLVSCSHPLFGDTREVRIMRRLLRRAGVAAKTVFYDSNPLTMQGSVGGYDAILSQRLHPLIYGATLGRRALSYGRTEAKFLPVLREIGLEQTQLQNSCGTIWEHHWGTGSGPLKSKVVVDNALSELIAHMKLARQ